MGTKALPKANTTARRGDRSARIGEDHRAPDDAQAVV